MDFQRRYGILPAEMRSPLVATALAVGLASSVAGAAITNVTTTSSGSLINVDSITLSDRGTFSIGQLVNVTLTNYSSVTENNGDNSVGAIIDTTSTALPTGSSRLTPIEDNALNTGVVNVRRHQNSTIGVTVQFNQPVFNLPGDDVVLADLVNPSSQVADPFRVSLLGPTGALDIVAGDFTYAAAYGSSVYNHFIEAGSGSSVDLTKLQNNADKSRSLLTGTGYRMVAFDLSDLGVPLYQSVTGLVIRGDASDATTSTIDPMFIAGLVPEPASLSVLGLAGAILLRRWR